MFFLFLYVFRHYSVNIIIIIIITDANSFGSNTANVFVSRSYTSIPHANIRERFSKNNVLILL